MKPPIRTAWESRPGWSPFGRVGVSGVPHKGFDYYVPAGTPVYATGPGTVTSVAYNGDKAMGFGHNITIAMDDGRRTLDAHFLRAPSVGRGARVNENTVIGYVGNTGNAYNVFWKGLSHDHHQEWNKSGALVNPLALFGTSWAGQNQVDITPDAPEEEETMKIISNGAAQYFMNGSDITHITPDESTALQLVGVKVYVITHPQVQAIEAALNRTVLPELSTNASTAAIVAAAVDASTTSLKQDLGWITETAPYSLKALSAGAGAVGLTDAQMNELRATLAATLLVELKKGEDAQTALILNAIEGVDEATLVAFGLKRA